MKKTEIQNVVDGINSVNDELCDELFVNELETRLETDPLLTNGLLDLVTTTNAMSEGDWCLVCNIESNN